MNRLPLFFELGLVDGLGDLPLGVSLKDGSIGVLSSPSHSNPNAWDSTPAVPARRGTRAGPWMLSCEVPCGLFRGSLGITPLYATFVNTC
jgi:hypothetical protein